MTDESTGDRPPELTAVFAAVEAPERGHRLLPQLLGLLDDDEESHRLGACWAICHVLVTHPDMANSLVPRLLDRLDDEPSLETELLATYVWTRYPAVVDDAIETRRAEEDRYEPPSLGGHSLRAGPVRPGLGNRPIGRTRMPGEGSDPGPRQVYTDDEDERTDRERASADDDTEVAAGDGVGDADAEAGGSAVDEEPDPLAPPETGGSGEPPELLSVITYQSVFDSLSVVAGRTRTRYADRYRTLGVRDSDEIGVGLVLFHRPSGHREQFADELGGALDRWQSVAAHDNVVTLYDWGAEPRPWAVTEYTDLRLADRSRLTPDEAHWNAVELADALAHVHENGVVHGGIDPHNVAYYGNLLDDSERQPPLLTNVSLMRVVRRYFDPTKRLDPRYAAPEYFDRRFGQIDHATDIYHFGALCYRLFTGRAPFEGEYREVRDAILAGEFRRPSEVADVPTSVDDIVTKAMATEKLRRYESVTHLRAELRAMGASVDGG